MGNIRIIRTFQRGEVTNLASEGKEQTSKEARLETSPAKGAA